MAKKRSHKPFPIEANITEFNSISDLPGEFLTLLAHDSQIILTSDDDVEMVHQIIRTDDISIWLHDVFPRTTLMLVPFADKKVVSFQFNARNIILNEMEDGLPYKMGERDVSIAQMEDTAPGIPVGESDVLVRIHINLEQKLFLQLAHNFHVFRPISSRINHSLSYKALSDAPLRMTKVCEWMSETMCKTHLTGFAAKLLQRRCGLNMILNVASQFKQSDKSAQVSKSLQAILPKALSYLEINLKEPLDLTKMASDLGTFPLALHKAFCKMYYTTPAQYQFHLRMFKAISLVANTASSPDKIAREIGLKNGKIFTQLFTEYYSCSIETLRNNQ